MLNASDSSNHNTPSPEFGLGEAGQGNHASENCIPMIGRVGGTPPSLPPPTPSKSPTRPQRPGRPQGAAHRRVLVLLAVHMRPASTIREVAEATNLGIRMTLRAARDLERAGLLKVDRVRTPTGPMCARLVPTCDEPDAEARLSNLLRTIPRTRSHTTSPADIRTVHA